jgi:putative ABC transport system permease protein
VPLTGAGERMTPGLARASVRRGLIVGEVALSVVLLVAAGLHLRSLVRLQQVDPGFDAEHVLAATVFLSGKREGSDEQEIAFFEQVVERLGQRSGVSAAGAVTTLPMNPVGIDYDLPFAPDGNPPPATAERQEVDFRVVAGDYFRALGVPVVRGRGFDTSDRENTAPVVIVNQTLATRFFPGEDPVGRRVWVGGRIGAATVVGTVGDVHHRSLAARPRAELYVPFRQYPHGGMTIVVRAPADPALAARAVKDEIYVLDPDQPISDLVTLPELLHGSVSPQRFNLILLGGFAVLALLLAAVGVYGVIAYAVGQRSREIGIRMALGAASREIRRTIIRPAVGLAAIGVAFGSAAAWLLGRVLAPSLYEVSPHDPLTFAVVGCLLLAAASAACVIPARRASRVDPLIAMRSE